MCSPSLKTIIEKSRAAEGVGSPGSYKNINSKHMFWYKIYKEVEAANNNIFKDACYKTTIIICFFLFAAYFLLSSIYYLIFKLYFYLSLLPAYYADNSN